MQAWLAPSCATTSEASPASLLFRNATPRRGCQAAFSDGIVDSDVHGDAGNDRIVGANAADSFFGDAGLDAMFGGNGDDTMDGGADSDNLRGQGDDDYLSGGDGVDILIGGRGNDTLNGGSLQDTLRGGPGEDVFVYARSGGVDRVRDFHNDVDELDLLGFGYTSHAAARAKFVDVSGNVEFRFSPGDIIVIGDMTKALIGERPDLLTHRDREP